MPDDDPIAPLNTSEQPRPALFVDTTSANAPPLPAFDRLCPPAAADLPRLLTPAQVAVVFGISVEAARNDGNRKKLGPFTVIDEQKYYQAEEVVRRWHERYDEKVTANKNQTGQQSNSLTAQTEIVLRVAAAIERIAEGGGSQGEVTATLARTVEAQQQEIKRLTEALENSNRKGRTWWARLFGGA